MEITRDTKIGIIDFSYDEFNDAVIAYTDDGENEWTDAGKFRPSFSDFIHDNELNIFIQDNWNYGSESHYTTETHLSIEEYIKEHIYSAKDDFTRYVDYNLKLMGLIE